jgi:hypothetical protein
MVGWPLASCLAVALQYTYIFFFLLRALFHSGQWEYQPLFAASDFIIQCSDAMPWYTGQQRQA